MNVHFNAPDGVSFDDVVAALFAVYYDRMSVPELRAKIVSDASYYRPLGEMCPALDEVIGMFPDTTTVRLSSIELRCNQVILEVYSAPN